MKHRVLPGTASLTPHLPNTHETGTAKTQSGMRRKSLRGLMGKSRGLVATSWKAEGNWKKNVAQRPETSEGPE